jgi:hypothetical protein
MQPVKVKGVFLAGSMLVPVVCFRAGKCIGFLLVSIHALLRRFVLQRYKVVYIFLPKPPVAPGADAISLDYTLVAPASHRVHVNIEETGDVAGREHRSYLGFN